MYINIIFPNCFYKLLINETVNGVLGYLFSLINQTVNGVFGYLFLLINQTVNGVFGYLSPYQPHSDQNKQKLVCAKKIVITQSEIYRRGNVENGWKSLIMLDHAWKCQ